MTASPASPKYAIAVERTEDSKVTADHKTRPVSVTHASQHSCSTTCPFMGSGCYAETGTQAWTTNRLNKAAVDVDSIAIALQEAEAIDKLSGRNTLRLHVVGDCAMNQAARIIAQAVARYRIRGFLNTGRKPAVYTYTHAWRTVDRDAWGPDISVLASCETPQDVADATARGYAVALVAEHAELPRTIAGLRTVKCPQQTGTKADCATCLMCAQDSKLQSRALIVLDPHGATTKVKAAIAARQ